MSFWSWLTGKGAAGVSSSAQFGSPWSERPLDWQQVTLAGLFDVDVLPVSRQVAMRLPAVARARNVLCGLAATLPLVAQTSSGPAAPQPDICRVLDKDRPYSISMGWLVDQLLFEGVCWLVVAERDWATGYPLSAKVAVKSELTFDVNGWPVSYQGRPWTDYIQIPAHHEGVLNYGKDAIRQAIDLAQSAARSSVNPVPSMELHQTTPSPTLTDDDIQKLLASWRQARAGKYGGIAYTPSTIQAIAHGQAAEQLLIEGRKYTDLEMARLLGVPAWVIDAPTGGSTLSYSNIESRTRELLAFGLSPYLADIEDRFSMDDILPPGVWANFDTTQALAGDLKTRSEAYMAAQQAGILTPDDARALERGITPNQEAGEN